MRGHPQEIEQAFGTLTETVADRLSAAGWTRRGQLGPRFHTALTRTAPDGVLAVVEIARTSFGWPDDWPAEAAISLGVGYEPALNLMPLLTLPPLAALIQDPEHGRASSFTVTLSDGDDVAAAAERIGRFVAEHAAVDLPDAAAIDAQLQRDVEAARTRSESEDGDSGAADRATQLRLVLLAAMGRLDETRALLAGYPAEREAEGIDRADRRFIRQLTRWLDAGGPPAPPIAETLALIPRRERGAAPSWADTQARSRARKEALDAVRARAKGRTREQLEELIAAEYRARAVEVAPSAIDFHAELLHTEQRPFGRARNAVRAIRLLGSAGSDLVRTIKHPSDDDPEWLQPPDRAGYPMIGDRGRYTPVQLDAAARDWIERVWTEAPRRMAAWALIEVWLARDDAAGQLVVSIGRQRVGTIAESDVAEFDPVLRAAALFDEDPSVRSRLTVDDRTAVLEVPLPQRPGGDPPADQ